MFDYWLKFVNVINSFKKLKLYDYILASIEAKIPIQSLDKTFKKMFYTQWFLYLMSNIESINSFGRMSQDKAVENFKEKDKLKFQICFLMSPLSVSTYLSDDKVKFDVVIFDEASQIFPWDALGSIYRARQIIVIILHSGSC